MSQAFPPTVRHRIHYVTTDCELSQVIPLFSNTSVLGYDHEWPPNRSRDEHNLVTVIQLATAADILVLQLCAFVEFPPAIRSILESDQVLKVGAGLTEDCKRLQLDHHVTLNNWSDLSCAALAQDPLPWQKLLPPPGKRKRKGKPRRSADDCIRYEPPGLARLVYHYLGLHLAKPQEVRVSNWGAALNPAQVTYAAHDALAGLLVHNEIERFKTNMTCTGIVVLGDL